MRTRVNIDVRTDDPAAALMQQRVDQGMTYGAVSALMEEVFGIKVKALALARKMQRGNYSLDFGLKLAKVLNVTSIGLEDQEIYKEPL